MRSSGYHEASFCRFACGETAMGAEDLTDGTYVWPSGLVHYVEQHAVGLPEAFVAHALAHPEGVGDFPLPKAKFGLFGAVFDVPEASWQRPGMMEWGGIWGNSWALDPATETTLVMMSNTMWEGVGGKFVEDTRQAVVG